MLTQEQREKMARFVCDYAGEDDPSEYVDEIEETRDLFERYDGSAWNEWSGQTYDNDYGFPAVHYEVAQARKGDERVSVWVMDFGDVRGIYQR